MLLCHGDYENNGELVIGADFDKQESVNVKCLVNPSHIANILDRYPHVRVTIFMTSCYSGYWVETVEFQGKNRPTVLAAAGREEVSFGFSWSHSQRHAGGLFSAATLTELLKEPIDLPPDGDKDSSREYRQLTMEITGEMHGLCLPINISSYGSTPVFSDPDSQETFWVRTGYALHNYRQNYNRLRRIPASDPHPKRDRKRFNADFVDDAHPDIVAWKQRHPGIMDEDYPEATAGYGGTQRGLYSSGNVGCLISRYLRSEPGPSEQGEHNLRMRRIRRYWNHPMDDAEKQSLRLHLIGILELNRQANEYARALNLYKLGQIEHWIASRGLRMEQYTYEAFLKIYSLVHESRLFHFPEGSKVPSYPFYRKPAQFLAASMATAGYNEKEVAMAIDKLWQMRKGMGFMDAITLKYLSSGRYQKSASNLSTLLKDSRRKSKVSRGHHPRPSLSDIHWSQEEHV